MRNRSDYVPPLELSLGRLWIGFQSNIREEGLLKGLKMQLPCACMRSNQVSLPHKSLE